jgi:ribokinase
LLTILNPAPADGRLVDSAILPLVDVLTPNETEAEMLVGRSVEDRASAVAAARALQQSGCRSVIVTLGARGSVVVQDGEAFVAAIEVAAVDATAAGDAFNGTLAVALAEGRSLVEAAHRANVAAGLAVTREGAQPSLPSRAEIEARIARHD